MEEKVYLEDSFTKTLVAVAWQEGLAMAYSKAENSRELNDREQQIVRKYGSKRQWKNQILQEIVLRENIYLHPFDDFEFNEEIKVENNIEVAPPIRHFDCSSREFLESGLTPAATYYLNSQGYDLTVDQTATLLLNEFIEKYEEIRKRTLESNTAMMFDEDEDVDWQLNEKVRNEQEKLKSFQDDFREIYQGMRYTWELYQYSSELESPVLWNVPYEVESMTTSEMSQTNSNAYTTAAIYFDELKSVKVNSLQDALDLRKSRQIDDFRDEVLTAIQGIKQNNKTLEEVESHVNNANRILDEADIAGRTGAILTIAPVLAPPEPFSKFLTPLGIGSILYEKYIRSKYSWAFVSRYS